MYTLQICFYFCPIILNEFVTLKAKIILVLLSFTKDNSQLTDLHYIRVYNHAFNVFQFTILCTHHSFIYITYESLSLALSLSPLFSPFEFIALEIENWESMQCWWWWLKSTTPLLRACYDNEDNPDRFGL
jgi:hypothetical protein